LAIYSVLMQVDEYYFKPFYKLPLDEITHEQITLQLQRIKHESGTDTAWSCYVALNAMLNWAIEKGMHPGPNPTLRVDVPEKSPAREMVLTDDEIRTIWLACEAWEAKAEAISTDRNVRTRTRPDLPRAVQLLFLTACRAQEIGNLKWSEIDPKWNEFKIPGTRTKNKNPLYLPLTDTALNILKAIKERPGGEDHVFGIMSGKGLDVSRANRVLNERITDAGGVAPSEWRLHDIRRTVRTQMGEIGISPDIAERFVNHKGNRTEMERTYDRGKYRVPLRDAAVRWEARLLSIVYGTEEKIAAPPRFGGLTEVK
jgi:integrase